MAINQVFVVFCDRGDVCETFLLILTQQIDLILNCLLFKLEIIAAMLI